MKKTVHRIFLAFVPATLAVVAALFVLPGAPDSFESPKRLIWCVFAVGLVVAGFFRETRTTAVGFAAAGWALLGWMALRIFAGPFWRGAPPFVAWALPLLILLLASRLRWREAERLRLVRTVAVLGVAEAALMLCQRLGCDPLFGATTSAVDYAPGRMIGTIGYQNQAAEFLGVALVCAVAGWRSRAVRVPAAVLLGGTMVLTANRGALFALAATAVVFAVPRLVRSRRTVARAGAAALLAAALLFAVPQTRARLADLARPSRSLAVQSRIWMGRVALSLWRDHPALGAGAGGYAYEYVDRLGDLLPERKEHALIRALVWAREAHCDPLQFAAEFGLVGLALALVFLAMLVRSLRKTRDAAYAGPAALFLSCCSLFSFSWQTSLAAPTVGLLLGMAAGSGAGEASGPSGASDDDHPLAALSDALSAVAAVLVLFVAAGETLACSDLEDAYWDAAAGETPFFLRGGRIVEVAGMALRDRRADLAASLCEDAEEEWMSPELLLVEAQALEAVGRGEEAADAWRRLERCGLRHHEALRGLSLCLERRRLLRGAAEAEAERFRLWPSRFSDGEVYRLCALKAIAGEAGYAERVSRRFRDRAASRGETAARWTPEWANLRGGALLALGRKEEARECFEDAVRRNPGLVSARRNLQSLLATDRDVPSEDPGPDPRIPDSRKRP